MKNLILLFCLVSSLNLTSQNFFKNRIAIDYSAAINVSSTISNVVTLKSYTRFIDNDFNINIRMSRKVSLALITGYKTYDYQYGTGYYENGSFNSINNQFQFNEFTYGVGVNFYVGRNYAPIGHSFGFFYKVSNYLVDDYNDFYAFLQVKKEDDYVTSTQINYQVAVLGFKLDRVVMLSNKVPVFFKYGGSLSVPLTSQIFDASFLKRSFTTYSKGLNDRDLLSEFKRKEFYKIYFGLGYMF